MNVYNEATEQRIRELESLGWWSNPNTSLNEVTTRHVVGQCARCKLEVWEDDTGQVYCEGCPL